MKKIILLMLSAAMAFAININTASKTELMTIKGIGAKKADALIKYRKSHKNMKIKDLKNIKGFGVALMNNITKDIKKLQKNQ